jgi:hypothetical protein
MYMPVYCLDSTPLGRSVIRKEDSLLGGAREDRNNPWNLTLGTGAESILSTVPSRLT